MSGKEMDLVGSRLVLEYAGWRRVWRPGDLGTPTGPSRRTAAHDSWAIMSPQSELPLLPLFLCTRKRQVPLKGRIKSPSSPGFNTEHFREAVSLKRGRRDMGFRYQLATHSP